MKIHDGYVLTTLSGQDYLLPYGQNIVSFRRGVRLNATGRLIWDALCAGKTEDELLPLLAAHFHASEAELPALTADIAQFLSQLRALGIVDRQNACLCFHSERPKKFYIGTVLMQLNFPDTLISDAFSPFAADTADCADLTISVRFGAPSVHPVGRVLVRGADLMIIEAADCYSLLFPASSEIIECQIDKDAHFACFYCKEIPGEGCREELFHGVRFLYLMRAQAQGLFAIHSASFLYQERAWLFSAVSGTGKSTHTNLWKEIYDVRLLNGDLNLLGIKDDSPVVYGLPWCGTSGISTTETVPLGGVIFLRQAPEDQTEALSADAVQLMLSQRLISPSWTKEMLLCNLSFTGQLAPLITSFRLLCTMKPSAAHVCKAAIDAALAQQS